MKRVSGREYPYDQPIYSEMISEADAKSVILLYHLYGWRWFRDVRNNKLRFMPPLGEQSLEMRAYMVSQTPGAYQEISCVLPPSDAAHELYGDWFRGVESIHDNYTREYENADFVQGLPSFSRKSHVLLARLSELEFNWKISNKGTSKYVWFYLESPDGSFEYVCQGSSKSLGDCCIDAVVRYYEPSFFAGIEPGSILNSKE